MNFYYIEKENLKSVFRVIYEFYAKKEEVPIYENDQVGIDRLIGILDGVQSNLYPTLLDKATYIFIQINKGHFFSNGNKRLALALTVVFLLINNKTFPSYHMEKYTIKIRELFPTYTDLQDEIDFKPEEYGMYNLSIIVADSNKYINDDFDLLKLKVNEFLKFATNN